MTMPAKPMLVSLIAALTVGLATLAALSVHNVARAAADELRVAKGDLPDCGGEVWPQHSARCLTGRDGREAPPVRFVTIGYQSGDNTTLLLRLPAGNDE
jgi:hypothetical protein